MKEEQDETLFDFKVKKNKKQKIQIKDISLIPGFDSEDYMVGSVSGLGLLDDNIYLVKKGERYTVIDGYRRIMSSKLSGETEIMAYAFDTIDAYKAAMITLATNNARSNNPIAELNAIIVLEKQGIPPETIRKYANVSKSKISKLKTLVKLDPVLTKALKQNKITFTMAYEIAKMDKKEQAKLVKIYLEDGKLTGDDLRDSKKKVKEKMAAELPDSLFNDFEVSRVDKLFKNYEELRESEKAEFLTKIGAWING